MSHKQQEITSSGLQRSQSWKLGWNPVESAALKDCRECPAHNLKSQHESVESESTPLDQAFLSRYKDFISGNCGPMSKYIQHML